MMFYSLSSTNELQRPPVTPFTNPAAEDLPFPLIVWAPDTRSSHFLFFSLRVGNFLCSCPHHLSSAWLCDCTLTTDILRVRYSGKIKMACVCKTWRNLQHEIQHVASCNPFHFAVCRNWHCAGKTKKQKNQRWWIKASPLPWHHQGHEASEEPLLCHATLKAPQTPWQHAFLSLLSVSNLPLLLQLTNRDHRT